MSTYIIETVIKRYGRQEKVINFIGLNFIGQVY